MWSPFHDKGLIFHSSSGNSSSNTSSTVTSVELLRPAKRPGAKFLERACYWTIPLLADILTRLRKGSPLTPKASTWYCNTVVSQLKSKYHEI